MCARLLATTLALSCTVFGTAAQPVQNTAHRSDIEASLVRVERQRANAILNRNTSALRMLMDRYYRHVESRGRVRSKTELITALERGDFRFELYENESTEIQVLDGGKTAVVAGVFKSRQPGSKLFRGRFVRVWVKTPEGWKNTFHQGTEIKTDKTDCECN
ncbi:hypothetical protein ASF77_07835 [Massilia sp. Leaf139]|nr:hypothetical protein ASF77_07835 [Massilia sp. Leaf139]